MGAMLAAFALSAGGVPPSPMVPGTSQSPSNAARAPAPRRAAPSLTHEAFCRTEGLSDLIGKPATAARAEQARVRAHAGVVRVLAPGSIVTQEFSVGRLNLHTDKHGKIVRALCG